MNYSERDLLVELAVANQTIKEAEEAFDKLRKDYHIYYGSILIGWRQS